MTRKTPILMLLLSLAFHASSQISELEFIVKPALTSLRGNRVVKEYLDPTINLSVGIGANYSINQNTLINLGILFEQKGGRKTSTITVRDQNNEPAGEVESTLRSSYQYITVPVEWRKRFGSKIRFEYGIGAYTSFLLKAQTEATSVSQDVEDDRKDVTSSCTKFDAGISASFKMLIPISEKLTGTVGFNDNLGLVNTSAVPVVDDGSIKHNSAGLHLGLLLKL